MYTLERRQSLFQALFPKSVFAELVVSQKEADENIRREKYQHFLKHVMQPAVENLLMFMAKDGALQPIANTDGHRIYLADAWNRMQRCEFRTGARDNTKDIAMAVSHVMLFRPLRQAVKNSDEGLGFDTAVDVGYDALVNRAIRGTLSEIFDRIPDLTCGTTDVTFEMRLADWQPSLWYFDRDMNDFAEIEPIGQRGIQHLTIELRTGNLLVADTIHLKAFRDAFEKDYSKPSINSTIGCEMETARYASRGVIHVTAPDRYPTILKTGDGELVLGQIDDDAPGSEAFAEASHGRVYTDVWWVTMVERETLEEIVAESTPCPLETAQQVVAKYLEEMGDEVKQVTVAKGVKHLYFAGEPEIFEMRFQSPDLKLSSLIEPLFVLTDREIRLEQKVAPAARVEEFEPG